VVAADINGGSAKDTVSLLPNGSSIAVQADVASEDDARRMVAEAEAAFGRLDILVNNAAIWARGTVEDFTVEQWDRLMAVNVRGVYLCSRFAVPVIARQGGSIIHIASQSGLRGTLGGTLYVASKHAVVGMTKCMALDYGPRGIRVNAICPGLIDTPMGEMAITARGGDVAGQRQRAEREFPLGRIGMPEDVANAAVHLASDESSWVTGMCYSLDGGSGLSGRRA
jgi:NAD(P)-dependent dehydrogenase (short-subunit alcohol dehydrogenase family)